MATMVKTEVPTEVRREIPPIPRRRLSWWMLAVIVALVVGLVAGAAGWQATRGTSAVESTGNATAATKALAQRYVAAGLWSRAQAQLIAPNAVRTNVLGNEVYPGMKAPPYPDSASALRHLKVTERVVVAGPNGFVTMWALTKPGAPLGTVHGVTVSQVKNGKIIKQSVYYNPSSKVLARVGYALPGVG